METRKIRVLISKVGLDGHNRGAKVVSALLRQAGLEVVYLGEYHSAEEVVQAALQEDVDVVGLSCLCGEHVTYAPEVARLLCENQMSEVLCVVGGVIPTRDVAYLRAMGFTKSFRPARSSQASSSTSSRMCVECLTEARPHQCPS